MFSCYHFKYEGTLPMFCDLKFKLVEPIFLIYLSSLDTDTTRYKLDSHFCPQMFAKLIQLMAFNLIKLT